MDEEMKEVGLGPKPAEEGNSKEKRSVGKKHYESKLKVHSGKHTEHHSHHQVPVQEKKAPNYWSYATLVLAILLAVSVFTQGFSLSRSSQDETTANTLEFINKNLLGGRTTAQLKEVKEESGLYLLKLQVSGQEFESYVTKDGKIFLPQVIKVEEFTEPVPDPVLQELPKSDKPEVELFVMSHCPYGTQAEKGILPVVDLLGSKISFDVKFVHYAMHGEKEIKEQMNQICIKTEQKEKFKEYLSCFLDQGEGDKCLSEAGIDASRLTACVNRLDTKHNITASYGDRSTWLNGRYPRFDVYKQENERYEVGGSPTLVINGQQADSGRSPAEYLSTICRAFNTAPEECTQKLSTASFSSGFGYEASGGAATGAAACGN